MNPIAESRLDALEDVGVASDVIAAMRRVITDGTDRELLHIDPVEFARQHAIPEAATLDGFLHAAKLGVFDMAWNIVCPDCGGILSASVTLRQIRRSEMGCALCDSSYECDLDAIVAVTFTVDPQVRAIRGHRPEDATPLEYLRDHYLGPTLDLPLGDEFLRIAEAFQIWNGTVAAGARVTIDVELAPGWVILQEPRLHSASIIEIAGDPRSGQELAIELTHAGSRPGRATLAPGPIRFVVHNRTDANAICLLEHANDALHAVMHRRKPYLTGKQVVTNQTFRNIFQTDVLDLDQGLKLRNLTVLFTDLRGSTELYERIGDLAAYDLVRRHFGVLGEVVRGHGGSVVKTIGDAVMASFATPSGGMAAALAMRDEMLRFNRSTAADDLELKIGLHAGPCLAVWSNDRLDFFGQTVNIAARVQSLATAGSIFATEGVAQDATVIPVLAAAGVSPRLHRAALRGIRDEVTVYEVPAAQVTAA
jgi:class 3 adenylate cyclase